MAWKKDPVSARKKELPPNWPQIRKTVLDRDKHQCQWPDSTGGICGARATHCDHIERGQDHRTANLRALCIRHHMQRTGRDGGENNAGRPKLAPRERPAEENPWIKPKK